MNSLLTVEEKDLKYSNLKSYICFRKQGFDLLGWDCIGNIPLKWIILLLFPSDRERHFCVKKLPRESWRGF